MMQAWRVLGVLLLALVVGVVHAAGVGGAARGGISRTSAGTATGGWSSGGKGTPIGDLLRKPSHLENGQYDFQDLLKMPFKPKDFAEDVAQLKGRLTPRDVAKMLRGGAYAYVAGEMLAPLLEQACIRLMGGSMQMNESGAWQECVPGPPPVQSDGYEYKATYTGTTWHLTNQAACDEFGALLNAAHLAGTGGGAPGGGTWTGAYTVTTCNASAAHVAFQYRRTNGTFANDNSSSVVQRRVAGSCAGGQYVWPDGTCHAEPPVEEVSWRDIPTDTAEGKLADAIADPANGSKVIDAVGDYLDKGGIVDLPSVWLEGPASSPVSTQETTGVEQIPGGGSQTVITTTTNVTNYTYNTNTVTATQTTTTTTRDTSGNVIRESTTTGNPEAGDSGPADTPMPPLPKLYERKYPNGMVGIWDEYKDRLQNTALVSLATSLMPSITDGGTCPSWIIDLDWDWWIAYGSHDVAPPCWIWDVAAAILVFSALLLARSLIFGG